LAGEYGFPQCRETVEAGVWWPDLECAEREFRRVDAELNQTWKKAYSSKSVERKRILLADQRRWVAKKEKICSNLIDYTGDPELIRYRKLACGYKFTSSRIKYLRSL
jgi:uncharacterized protein YecT (DUF1311 family)